MPQFLDRLPETRRPLLWLSLLCLLLWLPGFFTLPPFSSIEFHTASLFFDFSISSFSRYGFLPEKLPDSVLWV